MVGFGVVVAALCIVVGGWIMFKGTRSIPGEGFLGGVPKGEVFNIPDATFQDEDEQAEDKKAVLANTERFLNILGGKS
jgi:hypothetical protein